MKAIKRSFFVVSLMAMLAMFFGTILFPTQNCFAQDNHFQTIADKNFSMNVTAVGRRANTFVEVEKKNASNSVDDEVEFYCMKWRDLQNFTFNITKNAESEVEILSYKLLVTCVQHAETLDPSFGVGTTAQPLLEGTNFTPLTYFYYIDSSADSKNNANSSNGHDFGLYKFDFAYTHLVDEKSVSNHLEINIAVLPDSIDEIVIPANLEVLYSVSSSQKLLNKFNFQLSANTFQYVNPARLQWEVTGTDINNLNYCLDEAMQQRHELEYAGFELVYDASLPVEKTTGTTFQFDSNNIEGKWDVTLVVKNSSGQTIFSKTIPELSTIKTERKSNLWLILLLCFLVVLLVAIVVLVIYLVRRKKEKVW